MASERATTVRPALRSVARLGLLDLVDAGTSVIVIEHHQAVMAHADHRPGPRRRPRRRPGRHRGRPADLVAARSTLTAEHLAADAGA